MSRPTWNTWEGGTDETGTVPPRRPSADDLGGDAKVDNYEQPPDDVEHYTAQGWNQKVKQNEALARVAESCKIEVRFNGGGVPFVNRCIAPSSLVTNATFTPTDHATGDTTIAWPPDTFPPFTISPNGLTLYSSATQPTTAHVEEVANGIRVRTFLWSGSAWALSNIPWSINLN